MIRLSGTTVIRSLTWFEDAEADPAPRMLQPMHWAAVKKRIAKAVASL